VSRIDDLIGDLCPHGVPLKALGQVGVFIRGNGLQKSDLREEGVPAIHYGQIHTHYGVWSTEAKSFTEEAIASKLRHAHPGDLLIATTSEDDAAVAKATAWLGATDVVLSGDAYIYRHELDPKYVSYFFQSTSFQDQKRRFISGTKVRRVAGDSLAKIQIPVPPIEIQREIVRVLDKFTQLEEELEAELEARRAQYEHYVHALFAGIDDSPTVPIGRLLMPVSIPRGVKRSAYGAGKNIPIIDQGQSSIAGYTDDESLRVRGDQHIVFGDHTRVVKWVDHDFAPGADGTKVFRARQGVLPRYAYFAFKQLNIPSRGYNRHWTVARDMEVPLPALERQHEIVRILDNFDALVNDISVGLPAELAARRKQYEYYRDRLLTFKELAA